MPEEIISTQRTLAKAQLVQIKWDKSGNKSSEVSDGVKFTVQFNPSSLRVSYSNQVQTGDQSKPAATQFVGRGSTKMSVELVLDVSMPIRTPSESEQKKEGESGEARYKDVRAMTEIINKFIQPEKEKGHSKKKPKYIPPGVRFIWGTFLFEGIVESMEETLELWSEDGVPLRATVSLNLSQQGIFFLRGEMDKEQKDGPGTTTFQPVASNENVQQNSDKAGQGDKWKTIAAAHEIDNPRFPQPGQLLDMNVAAGASARLGGQMSGAIGFDAQTGLSASAGVSGSAGISGSALNNASALAGISAGASASASGSVTGGLSAKAAARAKKNITF